MQIYIFFCKITVFSFLLNYNGDTIMLHCKKIIIFARKLFTCAAFKNQMNNQNINKKMKKLKFLSLALCAIATVTLSSCWDDDDNNGLTPEQKATCFSMTRGEHNGTLVYTKAGNSTNVTNNNDTVPASWNIATDSTMVIYSVPSLAIASAIDTTMTDNKEVYRAILEQPAKNINCAINYYRTDPIAWIITPTAITYDNITYRGKQSKLQIAYFANYCVGSYSATSRVMQIQIVIAGAYIDGSYAESIIPQNNARALLFTEKK